MLSLQEVEDAAQVVYAAMPPTAQYAWPLLARRTGCAMRDYASLVTKFCPVLDWSSFG